MLSSMGQELRDRLVGVRGSHSRKRHTLHMRRVRQQLREILVMRHRLTAFTGKPPEIRSRDCTQVCMRESIQIARLHEIDLATYAIFQAASQSECRTGLDVMHGVTLIDQRIRTPVKLECGALVPFAHHSFNTQVTEEYQRLWVAELRRPFKTDACALAIGGCSIIGGCPLMLAV